VKTYSRVEVAEGAGVSLDKLDQLVALGIVGPTEVDQFSSGDLRRVAMAQSLEDAGIPLDGLAAAISRGELSLDFMDASAYERFSSLSRLTFQELSDKTGVPVDLLMIVREASGSVQPSPKDQVRDSEMAIVPFLEIQIAEGFRPIAIERLLRVMGDSLRRITASEADWWQSEVVAPRMEAGMTSDEAINPDFTERIVGMAEQAMVALYHAQQAHAWTRNIFDGFEQSLIEAGLHSRLDRPPAMCFLDITGYTRLTQERGDAAAAELAEKLGTLVQRTSAKYGGRPVKWLGDGVMFWFRDPGLGVVAALEMVEGVTAAGLPPAHVGLHAGPVVSQEGDYYGQTVNLASRIADYARPGEVLVSQVVIDASPDVAASFTEIGPVELKGVAVAMQLHAAHRL
jgi:adenylate cyclase